MAFVVLDRELLARVCGGNNEGPQPAPQDKEARSLRWGDDRYARMDPGGPAGDAGDAGDASDASTAEPASQYEASAPAEAAATATESTDRAAATEHSAPVAEQAAEAAPADERAAAATEGSPTDGEPATTGQQAEASTESAPIAAHDTEAAPAEVQAAPTDAAAAGEQPAASTEAAEQAVATDGEQAAAETEAGEHVAAETEAAPIVAGEQPAATMDAEQPAPATEAGEHVAAETETAPIVAGEQPAAAMDAEQAAAIDAAPIVAGEQPAAAMDAEQAAATDAAPIVAGEQPAAAMDAEQAAASTDAAPIVAGEHPAAASTTDATTPGPTGTVDTGDDTAPQRDTIPDMRAAVLANLDPADSISDSDPSIWERFARGEVEGVEPVFYPADHYQMTRDAATAAGFDSTAASSLGNAARNVDYTSFSDHTSHANRGEGETTEQAVQANVDRAAESGAALRTALDAYAANPSKATAQPIVDVLGKFNHQLQDSFAHQGMSFEQHSHLDKHDQSPDANPESRAAAAAATREMFGVVTEEMRARGIDPSSFETSRTTRMSAFPEVLGQLPSMVEYLGQGGTWDQVDTRWSDGVNRDMMDAFRRGLTTK